MNIRGVSHLISRFMNECVGVDRLIFDSTDQPNWSFKMFQDKWLDMGKTNLIHLELR
jgi:hypothetical protein